MSDIPEVVVEVYDNGHTMRFMGTTSGAWIETNTTVNVRDYQ